MAARDIMPWARVGGGEVPKLWAPLTAGESFREGEPVLVLAAGTLQEFPADGTPALISDITGGNTAAAGIAAMDGDTTRTDGFAKATGDRTAYYPFNQGILFITRNFKTNAGVNVAKTGAMRGDIYQIEFNTDWHVSSDAGTIATDVCFLVHDVLDETKRPIATATTLTAGTGYFVGEIKSLV